MNGIDIIIVSRNGAKLTLDCIESFYQYHSDIDLHIILVDNCSTDDTVNLVKERFTDVKIIENSENYGYAKAVNIGFRNSNSDYVIVSNNDVIVHESTLKPLIDLFINDSTIGIVGPQQLDGYGNKGLSYEDLPSYISGLRNVLFIDTVSAVYKKVIEKLGYVTNQKTKDVGYIDGGFMMIRRSAYYSVGGFDEDYFFYTEEADFCHRLKENGWRVVFQPNSRVTHFRGGVSEDGGFSKNSIEMLINSKALYCKKNLKRTEAIFFLKAMKFRFGIWMIIHLLLANINIFDRIKRKKELHKCFYKQLELEIENMN